MLDERERGTEGRRKERRGPREGRAILKGGALAGGGQGGERQVWKPRDRKGIPGGDG
jgi:hypothetical protein